MRTKSMGGFVTAIVPGGEQYYRYNTKTSNWDLYGAYVPYNCSISNGRMDTITYDDTKRHGPIKRTRSCLHTTASLQNGQETHSLYLDSSGSLRKIYNWGGVYSNPVPLTIPDLSSSHLEALEFFKAGCVEQKFDLGADLFEWRQVSQLLPGLLSSFKNLLKFKSFKGTLKEFADFHLTYAFGIKPLVSDLMDFVEVLNALNGKVTWLRKNQGKPVKVRFSKDLSKINRPADKRNQSVAYQYDQEVITDYACLYSAFALISYDVQQLSDLELKLRVLTRSFGLDKPISTLYELMPWSFVLDWVLKVGDLLESITPAITLPLKILDIGYCVKIRETRSKTYYFVWPYKGDSSHYAGQMSRTLFKREPGLPTSFSLATGSPGANQLALSISLAIQRWK